MKHIVLDAQTPEGGNLCSREVYNLAEETEPKHITHTLIAAAYRRRWARVRFSTSRNFLVLMGGIVQTSYNNKKGHFTLIFSYLSA